MTHSRPYRTDRIAGILIAVVLLAYIFYRVRAQSVSLGSVHWSLFHNPLLLSVSVLLLLANLGVEALRWRVLAGYVAPVSFIRSLASDLAGLAFSLFTPGGLGDYPARVLFLNPGRTGKLRYTAVAILAILAQYITVLTFGMLAVMVNIASHPAGKLSFLLWVAVPLAPLLIWLFLNAERVMQSLSRWRLFRKLALYQELAIKLPARLRTKAIFFSALRFIIYNAQFLIFLYGSGVGIPLSQATVLSAMFFFILILVPSFAVAEVGIRGGIALFLFGSVTGNAVGVLSASTLLWLCNVILPALAGAFVLARMGFKK